MDIVGDATEVNSADRLRGRVAARWLHRYLEDCDEATIGKAVSAGGVPEHPLIHQSVYSERLPVTIPSRQGQTAAR